MKLIGKSAVVTGSTKGIGYGIADLLLAHGANVAISGRDLDVVARAAGDLAAKHPGRTALPVVADVTSAEAVESLLDKAEAEFGPLAIMVNNAGGGGLGLITDLSEDDWNAVLAQNLTSVFYGTRAAIQRMRASNTPGAIINIGSVETYGTTGGNAHYRGHCTKVKFTYARIERTANADGSNVGRV